MTEPTTPVRGRLDELDRLRAAATPGPWDNPRPFTKLIDAPGATDNLAIVQCDRANDAVLIVAAVNALPDLIAALRKVLADLDDLESSGDAADRLIARTMRRSVASVLAPAEEGR